MDETCQHLSYREEGDGKSFDTARAFCTVTESFVQSMRADVCNARYELDPATDCEFYVEPDSEAAPDAESNAPDAPDADR
ncbi:hypothetical protein [Halorubrum sodomense]|uniref:Uncharacterized protein n=1 Tax=Halorubrum sodomense TaxID=35743 RepID=A0A1I6FKI1_HALSD|nr:hypothetical protein [Halorubrum sodomense]SFR30465.1 hypothetical protein SAMN04487937_0288 [Halorubrum sodomense]